MEIPSLTEKERGLLFIIYVIMSERNREENEEYKKRIIKPGVSTSLVRKTSTFFYLQNTSKIHQRVVTRKILVSQ